MIWFEIHLLEFFSFLIPFSFVLGRYMLGKEGKCGQKVCLDLTSEFSLVAVFRDVKLLVS